jgi:putative pyruvate formate lyase activating enzyme
MIIRHLVLPNHLECCTKPVLRWIAENLPREKILVNIMDQYTPMHLVARYPRRWPEIARRPRYEEIAEARRYADQLGILWEPIS